MPLIPWAALASGTGRLLATELAAGLVNPILDAYCSNLPVIEEFARDYRNVLIPGLGDILSLPQRAINNLVCPAQPPPAQLPFLSPPLYGMGHGGQSFGAARGTVTTLDVNGNRTPPTLYEEFWECSPNRGFPVGSIRLFTEFSGAQYLGCLCSRADGGTYIQGFTPARMAANTPEYNIIEATFNPCPAAPPLPPILPPRPGLPARLPPLAIPLAPTFPINIELPQLPGLPPITIPIVYAPITPSLSLNAPITLAPNIGLNPNFSFAPKIELNLGGISIGGGGYPEPVSDVEELCPGSDCPDPCTPVDYDRIRTITFEELDSKLPPSRPNSLTVSIQPVGESNTFVLPRFTQWIELRIITPPPNVRMQTGGALAPEVAYNGWYSFGATGEASERIPFHYNFISIRIPEGISEFSYTVYSGGTAQATIGYLLEE